MTTAVDMTVPGDADHFGLAMDTIDCLLQNGDKNITLTWQLKDNLRGHTHPIHGHGGDLPEVLNRGWALFVRGYALVWFLVHDHVKQPVYRVFDPTAAPLLGGSAAAATPR